MKNCDKTEIAAAKPLRVLIIEDRPDELELTVQRLRRAGVNLTSDVAQTEEEFVAHLERGSYDVILADYSLPAWSGMEALEILHQRGLDIPFILVTGTAGEETAVDCIKRGASDYILKDRLARLPVAVSRALEEKTRRDEQARMHRELRESEERYRGLFEEAPIAYQEIDREGRVRRVNRAGCALLGCGPEEILGRTVWEFAMPEVRDAVRNYVARKMLAQESIRVEREWVRPDGRHLLLEIHADPVLSQGQVTGMRGALLDITERRRTQEALRQNEQFLSSVFASIQDGLTVLDLEMNIVRVNPAMESAYAQASPLVGKKCWEAYHQRSQPCEACPSLRTIATGETAHDLVARIGPDGTPSGWVDLYSFPLLHPESGRLAGVIEYARDVTGHKRLEEQLRQAQKMEAIGRLAGGIAHDFNNLLMIIHGYGELLLEKLPADGPRHAAEEIVAASRRAASLTRQLLTFSRKQVLQPEVLDLNAVVANVDKMLRRLIGEDIELATRLAPGLARVKVDPGQIEQVLMNLAVNARDAMPGGGRLIIETANADLDENYASHHAGVASGSYVRLAVSDTGCGMDAETQAHIFEPFFTTKERGKGTGLGLATVYGIVEQSGGHIWVYSEVSRGTVFKIYLPTIDAPQPVSREQSVRQEPVPGCETVLVAEDDDSVRTLVCGALRRMGYTVLEARDGEQALCIAEARLTPIHLLITDAIMPRMNGRKLAELLAAVCPETRLLYMSGYTDDTIGDHGLVEAGIAFLQKPFTAEALSLKVREVLESSPRN